MNPSLRNEATTRKAPAKKRKRGRHFQQSGSVCARRYEIGSRGSRIAIVVVVLTLSGRDESQHRVNRHRDKRGIKSHFDG